VNVEIFKLRLKASIGLLRPVIFVLAISVTAPVAADVFTYVKLGVMDVDVSSKSDPINLALDLGYELDNDLADLSVVAEINRSIDDGRTRHGDDLEFESNGLYLVAKTTRSLFASVRVGVVENKIIEGSSSTRNDGVAIGGGIGVVIGRTRLQIEILSLAGDANHFTIGLQF
jgi:hypothetical protein